VHITGLPGNPTVWEEYQQKRKGAAQTTALPGAQEMTHRRSADDIGVSVLGTAECLHADSTIDENDEKKYDDSKGFIN
jgi:hypothetical protein